MASDKKGVKVTIMQREYTIACSDEEIQGVVDAAAHLDQQMQAIARSNQAMGADRCAIMAALNISHDLLEARKNMGEGNQVGARLDKLYTEIDSAMENIRQVAL